MTLFRKDQHSHLTMGGPTWHHVWKARPTLTSDPVRKTQHLYPTMGGPYCHHVEKAQHLYLIMWEQIPQSHQIGSALIYDHVGTHPTITSEWICTYIWPCEAQPSTMLERPTHLYLTMEGTNPITMSEGLMDSSLPLGRNLDLENTNLLLEVLKLHFGHF